MKTIKRIAGILILVVFIGLYLFALIQAHGLLKAIMPFGATILVMALAALAVWKFTGE